MAAGDFSASQILDIKLKAEEMWGDSRMTTEYAADAAAAVAVKNNTTAKITQLTDPGKDNKVIVTFLNSCDIEDRECESDCDIDGPELESGSKEYELDKCREVVFSVNAEKNRTNMYTMEEEAAQGMAKAVKKLDEYWSTQVLLALKDGAGINVHPLPWTQAAMTTTIPANQYALPMFSFIKEDMVYNRIGAPYYINNGDLFVPYDQAQMNKDNAEGRGTYAYSQAWNMYFDQWGFARAGLTESIFAVARGALAFETVARHSDTPQVIGGSIQQTRYTVQSQVIPRTKYDVFYGLKCITNQTTGESNIFHSWKVKTRGGIFLNPEGCPVTVGGQEYNPTGIISYTKGA